MLLPRGLLNYGPLKDSPKAECRGKKAAKALAVLVLDPNLHSLLATKDPKSLNQAERALESFGFPDRDMLLKSLLSE